MLRIKKLLILILPVFFLLPFVSVAETFSDGVLLRAEGDIKVYLINNNTRRWVSGIEVFKLNNFKWEDVRIVSKKEVEVIQEGEPVLLKIVLPTPLLSPIVSITPASVSVVFAKVNDKLPAPEYIRADWLVSNATHNYGRVGQKITFKYSDKEKDKIENFKLYEKRPGDRYFAEIAKFDEVLSTSCEDIDIEGEWMMTEAGQCGYWSIQRIALSGGGRGEMAYLPTVDYPVGDYVYYVVGVDKDGLETPASSEAKMVFLNPVSILSPIDNQQTSGVYPEFRWTIANDWPVDSTADYFLMISNDDNALSPVWTKQLKVLSGEKERQVFYNGLGLDPTKKYKVNIYGYHRESEYDPDYISIPFDTHEFWIKKPGWTSVFRNVFAAIFNLFF